MTDFVVGDKVRCFRSGGTGTIEAINEADVLIQWDDEDNFLKSRGYVTKYEVPYDVLEKV